METEKRCTTTEDKIISILENLKKRHKSGPFLPISSRTLNSLWRQAALDLRLNHSIGVPHVYVLRHSGAAADRLHQRRPPSEAKLWGKWRSDSSVRRYQKGGRALERLSSLSVAMQRYVMRCEQRVRKVLTGDMQPLCKPDAG